MPTATPTRKQVIQDFRRKEILAAAVKVFGQKGFDATLMADIAKAANLAKGTIYIYFPSKNALYEGVVKQALAELAQLSEEQIQREADFGGKLKAFIRVRIAYWQEKQALYRVILTLGREGKSKKRSIAWQREVAEYLARMFETAAAEGQIPQQDFLAAAWTAIDAIRGVNERRVFGEGTSPEQDTDFLTAFLLRAIGCK